MEIQEIKNILKALLFIANTPLTLKQFKNLFQNIDDKEIKLALDELMNDQNDSLQIVAVAEGYQMCTRKEYADWIRKLFQLNKRPRLSIPALETLAIIAYKQPVIKAEVEQIRGVNIDGVVHTLLEKKLIKSAGRKNVIGHPFLYETTSEFLYYFGLKDLTELPALLKLEETS